MQKHHKTFGQRTNRPLCCPSRTRHLTTRCTQRLNSPPCLPCICNRGAGRSVTTLTGRMPDPNATTLQRCHGSATTNWCDWPTSAIWSSWCTPSFIRPNTNARSCFNVAGCNTTSHRLSTTCRPSTAGNARHPTSSSGWINVELVAESATSRHPSSHRTAADSPIERSHCTACRDATTAPYVQPRLRGTSANRLPATPSRTATTMDRTISTRHSASASTADNKWKLVALL